MLPQPAHAQVEVQAIISLLTAIIGAFAYLFAQLLDVVVGLQNTLIKQEMVKIAWGTIRDFTNIFFILILVVIAFATILNIQKYSASSLLAKLIIAAILINFSLVIGQLIVDIFYVPAQMFVNAIGEGMSLKIADSLQLNQLRESESRLGVLGYIPVVGTTLGLLTGDTARIIVQGVFNIIFLLIALFAIILGVIALLGRIPIIMLLLIVSPAIWLASVLPNTQKFYEQWWNSLFKWSIFPVVYFAGIYFALFFTTQTEKAFSAAGADAAQVWGLSIQQTLVYVLGIAFLIGSFWAANKVGGTGGKWLYGMANAAWKGTGVPGGAKKAWTRVKEEGIGLRVRGKQVYGGQQAVKRREAAWQERLSKASGLPTIPADIARQREILGDVNKQIETIKDLPTADIQNIIDKTKASEPRGMAARIQKAETSALTALEFDQSLKDFRPNSLIAKRYYEAAAKNNFAGIDSKDLKIMAWAKDKYAHFSALEYEPIRSRLFDHLKDKVDFEEDYKDLDFVQQAMKLMPVNKQFEFGKEVSKKRPDLMARYKMEKEREEFAKDPTDPKKKPKFDNVVEYIKDSIGKLDSQKIAQDTDIKAWQNADFQEALRQLIQENPKLVPGLERFSGPAKLKTLSQITGGRVGQGGQQRGGQPGGQGGLGPVSSNYKKPVKIITADVRPENVLDLRNIQKDE